MSRVLVVNAGSTSLKLSVVDDADSSEQIASLAQAPPVDAVVHRVVHGGSRFVDPVEIDDRLLERARQLTELAPLHNGPALDAIDEARRAIPDVPHFAVFDTAFHRTIPEEASTYALPAAWRGWGIRRYGFHGLSVQWASERVQVPRLVVAHLGGGCSVTAVRDGRSVDTTMGFSPLEGVPMATRSGTIDAEIVVHLLRTERLSLAEIDHALDFESGLLGLSGESSDVRELLASESDGARLALAVFTYRVAGSIAAMAAALGGLDALVFTAGIGEGSAQVRADVCERLGFLGVELDASANASGDAEIGAGSARVVVVHAREDVVAARLVRPLLANPRMP